MIDKNDPRLTAYLLDELDSQEASAIESALRESPDLQQHLAELRDTIGTLNNAFGKGNEVDAIMTDDQLQQIESAANTSVTATSDLSGNDFSSRIRWRNFAIAALILYALGISVLALRKPPMQTAISTVAANSRPQPPESDRGETLQNTDATAAKIDIDNTADDVPASERRELTASSPEDASDSDPLAYPDEEIWQQMRRRRIDRGSDAMPAITPATPSAMNGLETQMMGGGEFGGEELGGMGMGMEMDMEMGMMGSMEMMMEDDEPRNLLSERQLQNGNAAQRMPSLRPGRSASDHPGELDPATDFFGDSLDAIAPPSKPSGTEGAGVIGDTNIQMIPELGTIVIRGNKRDVERVRSVIEEIESNREMRSDVETPRSAEKPRSGEGDDAPVDDAPVDDVPGDNPERVAAAIPKKSKPIEPAKTWKPASAATNRTRLSVGHHDDLDLTARDTYVRIDGFRARVFFDCYYYNDRPQQLEGQFMLRLPNDAALHYFAFGPTPVPTPDTPPATGKPGVEEQRRLTAGDVAVRSLREQTAGNGSDLARRAGDSNYAAAPNSLFGQVKAARVAPRQKAALAYDETVRRRVDPALVEWAGPGIFQTRVFPLVPNQLHRIIVGYDVTLRDDAADRLFSLQLPDGEAGGRVEFDIAASAGTEVTVSPEADAFVSGGRAYYRFLDAMPRDYTVRLTGTQSVVLNTPGSASDSYFATRLIADLPDEEAEPETPQAVFLLDTSWSDRPVAFSRRLKLLEQILEQNRDNIKQFAVLLFNVEQRWWRSEYLNNNAKNVEAFVNDANTLTLEGATDLHGALSEATNPRWMPDRENTIPQPNYFLLSDAAATWGKTDLASLADPLSQLDRSAGGGALFAYHLAGHNSDKATLQWLAEKSGGAVFVVAEEAELGRVAMAQRSRPWKIVAAHARGADEILIQGAAKTVYPNQPLVIAGRGRIDGPLQIELARGVEKKTIEFSPRLSIASPAAARLFGQLAVERLEPYAENLDEVTVAFARYFRVPGRTCSMIMLEGAADYERFGVNVSPQEDQLVIASTSIASVIDEQESKLLEQRENPRERFVTWVHSLESASLLNVSTALRLAMKRLPETSFRFDANPLLCHSWKKEQLDGVFREELERDAPGFDAVMQEAERRLIAHGADDALKTASTLIEAKPSDVDTLRSVAFRAIQWQRSDQAAPLLWRLTQARPYQPQNLLLLARAMSESGDVDSAIVCFELVSNGNWNERWSGAKAVAAVELLHVLEQVASGETKSAFPKYAQARLQQLRTRLSDEGLDLAVIMHWNTDRTDVDLHVTEPSGEECYYSHNRTKSGGRLTQDITEGLGPEMFTLENAPSGDYRVEAKYYSSDANRTKAPTETLLTVLRNVGRTNTQSQTKRITLNGTGEKQLVLQMNIQHE